MDWFLYDRDLRHQIVKSSKALIIFEHPFLQVNLEISQN